MNSPSKFTGLIMAFGSQAEGSITSSLTALTALLGEYSLKVMEWSSMAIRDRWIISALIEIHPDHTAPLDKDLQALAGKLGIDIASEFQPFSAAGSAGDSGASRASIIIAGTAISSASTASVLELLTGADASIRAISTEPHSLLIDVVVASAKVDELRQSLASLSLPVVLHEKSETGRKLFIFDMDSTLINEEVIDLLASSLGLSNEVSAITESAMQGEIDFATSLSRRVALLAGTPHSAIEEVRNTVTWTNGARELISAIHSNGDLVAVVSGGFHNVIDPILKDLGVDYILANTLASDGETLTGTITGRLIDSAAKAEFLREVASERHIDSRNIIAVGDGANDIEMVKAAAFGIAFCAKPALVEVADLVISERNLGLLIPLFRL